MHCCHSSGLAVGIVHALVGALIPLLLVVFMTRFFGKNRSFKEGLAIAPFALFASVSLTGPYVVVAKLLGPEFPSLLGALIGMAIVVPVAKKGWLLPKGQPWDFPPDLIGNANGWGHWRWAPTKANESKRIKSPRFTAWLPYLLVALLLVLTRLDALPFAAWLKAIEIKWSAIFGTTIDAALHPLYLLGTVFMLVSLMAVGLHRMGGETVRSAWVDSLKTTAKASVALVFTVPMVQVFLNSDGGVAGYDKMPIVLADGIASLAGGAYPLFAPFGRWVRGICCGEQHDQQHDVFAVPV